MPKLQWAICCKQAIVNQKSNNVSLIEILEQFNVTTLPTVVPQTYFLVSHWEKEDPSKNIEEIFLIRFVITSNPESISEDAGVKIEMKISQDKRRVRHLCPIQGIPIRKEGMLYIVILSKPKDTWKEICRIPIEIKKMK